MRARRLLHAVLYVLTVGCFLVGIGTSSASAQPSVPGVPDCKEPPAAQEAGNGLAGVLDPEPDPLPPASDPFKGKGSIYDQYGYAGLRWGTYDLGCGGSVRDPGASADTMMGNAFLGVAVAMTAVTNGIHNKVAQPDKYMAPLDKVVNRVTQEIHDSIWSPWGGVALIGVAALLLIYSLRGQLSAATSAAAWSILVLAILAGVAQYPARASSFFDEGVTSTIGEVQASTAGVVTKSDSARAQGALTVDRVLYDSWLRGQLGATDSPAAKRWGPSLLKASTISWHEAQEADSADERKDLLKKKSKAWQDTAEEIEKEDPSAYQVLQGKAGGRAGSGFMALVGALFTCGFRFIADIFLLVGLVLLRLLVMFLPAAAVVGILAPMSSVLRRMANLGGAAVINVVAFSVGAAVHTTAVAAVLESADGVGMTLMALVLCIVLTLAAFILMWPLLSFRLAFGSGGARRPNLRRIGRQVANYVVTQEAVENGIEGAERPRSPEQPKTDSTGGKAIPDDRPRSRPGTPGTGGVDEESERIYRSLGIKERGTPEPPAGALNERTAHDADHGDQKTGRRGPQDDDSVLVGSVVPHDVGPQSKTPAGVRTSPPADKPQPVRIYDPATKRVRTFRDSEED